MRTTFQIVFAALHAAFLKRAALHLEILALRQQVAILKRERCRFKGHSDTEVIVESCAA